MKRWKPPRSIRFTPHVSRLTSCWSGRWDLNPRQPAWKAGTLPLSYARPSLSAECPVLSPKPYFSFAQRSALITQKLPASSFGGQARIRTLEADGNRFTVCPLCPLGYLPEHRSRKFLVSVLRAQKQTIPHTAPMLSISPTGDYCSGWTAAILEAANFTSDIDICQVGMGFFCISSPIRANSPVGSDSADYLSKS
jgi:hypothetical protein